MGKQIHSQQGNQIQKGPIDLRPKLEEVEDQHGKQCCPNLNLNGIRIGSNKGLDLEVLLQDFFTGADPTLAEKKF